MGTLTFKPVAIPITIKIKENSFLARVAAYYMKADKIAMVIGRTIHLHNTSRLQFLGNQRWVRHEVAHVYQWEKLGKIRFAINYIRESLNKGYYKNRFEVEAREKETDTGILDHIHIV